jgi:hypothetical protein
MHSRLNSCGDFSCLSDFCTRAYQGWRYCSFPEKAQPTKSWVTGSFQRLSVSTTLASTMSYRFLPSTTSRLAMYRQCAEFSKRITEDFAISFGTTYTFLGPIDPTAAGANGFQNLETTFKYRVFKDPVHEFVMSVGLSVEWGGTGAANVGADPFHTYTPMLYFGKGLGDLPDTLSWIRPVAVTGQIGYAIPARRSTTTFSVDPDSGDLAADTEFHPRVLNWGGTIQYSMPYLKSSVIDLGLPDFVNHLITLIEATLQTPLSNTLLQALKRLVPSILVLFGSATPSRLPLKH